MNLEKLKERRKQLGYTQDDMAKKLKYKNKSSYCQIENGDTNIPLSKIKTICKILHFSEAEMTEIFL